MFLKSVAAIICLFNVLLLSESIYATEALSGCGEPLAKAWMGVQSPKHKNNLSEVNNKIDWQDQMDLLSDYNMNEQSHIIENYSDLENIYFSLIKDKVQKIPPYVTHRLSSKKFISALSINSLLSPNEAKKRGLILETYTPNLEDKLYGGFSCVYAALGPRQGRSRYGDVILNIDIESLPENSWATPSSGFVFMKQILGTKFSETHNVNEVEQRHYSLTVISFENLREFLPFMIFEFIRRKANEAKEGLDGESKKSYYELLYQEVLSLVTINNREKFWEHIDRNRLGYLEVKIPDRLNLDHIDSITFNNKSKPEFCNERPKDKICQTSAYEWPR